MKGKETKKEAKKEKKDPTTTSKNQSDYQKEKTRKSIVEAPTAKPKK